MRRILVFLWVVGCSSNNSGTPPPDMAQTPLQRGEYLVEHVTDCVGCHTPKGADGLPDRTKLLSGRLFVDFDPDPTMGAVWSANLTPHMTGLGAWTDAQIKSAIRDGVDKDGKGLFPAMPYFIFHNMTDADLDAVIAYLRSVPPVDNTVPEIQPLPFQITTPTPTLDPNMVPQTTLAAGDPKRAQADHGRYLAGMAGTCIDCHTPLALGAVPIDIKHIFAGNRSWDSAAEGYPIPPYPAMVYSSNLTPAATGLAGWTAAEIAATIKTGKDKFGKKLCGPMPFEAFAGMTDDDAMAIAVYLTTIPSNDNGVISLCTLP
jgi:mono/diheme cytochrome c family protein